MKTFVSLSIALFCSVSLSVSAQTFHPETVSGAVIGGVAGAVIGNNSGDLHHNAWKGAAIGTVAGALIGSAVGESREQSTYRGTQVPVPQAPRGMYYYSPGYYGRGYNYGYRSEPVYYSSSRYSGGNYAGRGLLLGGIAGAIIGHNSGDLHHNGWKGAAIGAGTGWLLGSIADSRARERAAIEEASQEQVATTQAAQTATQPQQVTIINNYYNTPSTPMSSANGMFGR